MNFPAPRIFTTPEDLRSTFGEQRLDLAPGAVLHVTGEINLAPNVSFAGHCRLEGPIIVETGSVLTDVVLGSGCRVRAHSVLCGLIAGARNLFGPFCFVRDGCRVGDDAILGAHVEAARSHFEDGVKVSHRAFIGDAEIGCRTIVGAGVVFCNYDRGIRRPSFVGSDTTLGSGTLVVAPRRIGSRVTVAAGSVVTRDLPDEARLIQKR